MNIKKILNCFEKISNPFLCFPKVDECDCQMEPTSIHLYLISSPDRGIGGTASFQLLDPPHLPPPHTLKLHHSTPSQLNLTAGS
jgi:hypothetical protein